MKKNTKTSRPLRMVVMAAFSVAIVSGAFWHSGIGTFSGLGVWSFAAICPLGFVETALAARTVVPWLLVPFLAIVVITALYGRVFCGWVCPVPLVRSWLPGSDGESAGKNPGARKRAAAPAPGTTVAAAASRPAGLVRRGGRPAWTKLRFLRKVRGGKGARPWPALSVLVGTLLSASIFGFPVFCLVCPIGLIFGTTFAGVHLVRTGQPSIDLLVFPAIVVLELVVVKKWCASLCPLGALLGLFAIFHRGLAPTIDHSRCLVDTKSSRCQECRKGCSFSINLRNPAFEGGLNECIKCRDCADNCPAKAISFPWWRK